MKASIESTSAIVEMTDHRGRRFTARLWQGTTESGVAFTCYMAVAQVRRDADNSEFVRDLLASPTPDPETQRAIDMRFIV